MRRTHDWCKIILVLLIVPVPYLLIRFPFGHFTIVDAWILDYCLFCEGPFLLIFSFIAYYFLKRTELAVLALVGGLVLIALEISAYNFMVEASKW